jgi:molybdopterin synthase sulfur carrier subunit
LVTVKFFATLHKATGEKSYQSSARNVAGVLKEVEKRYGNSTTRYLHNCTVLINGRNIGYLSGKRTKLKEGDDVSLFPPLAGG